MSDNDLDNTDNDLIGYSKEVIFGLFRDPAYTTDGGKTWETGDIDFHSIPIRVIGNCKHALTICSECVDSWLYDRYLFPAPVGTEVPDVSADE